MSVLLELEIAGHALDVSRVEGESRLGALFHFEVRAAAWHDAPAVADLLGQPFKLTLHDRFDRSVAIHGVTLGVERLAGAGGSAWFVLSLGPVVAPLAVGRDSRVFQEMSAVDIVK